MKFTIFGRVFNYFDKAICENIREFVYRNHSFFTISFLFLFFIEQAILLILVYLCKTNTERMMLIISGFALIVVTTATLEKIFLEIKLRHSEELRMRTIEGNEEFLEETDDLIKEHVNLMEENNQLKKEINKLKKIL